MPGWWNEVTATVAITRTINISLFPIETFSLSTLTNDTLVKVWIQQKVDFAVEHYLDGVNLYVDDALDKNSPDREKLTEFVKQLTLAFHGQLPHSMVVFNVPWSPINQIGKPVEGKDYDYLSISKIVDRVLIMEYEQKLQNFDSICQARPNIDLYYAIGGVWAWANTTINMSRTILGLPCYTHDYVCVKTAENYYCEVEPHEYRGVKCSSRVAKRIPYNQLDQYIKEHNIDNGFDEHADISVALYHVSLVFPSIRCLLICELQNKEDNMTHQIWIYDDDERIGLEFVLLDEFEMNGVAMFPVNGIDERMWKRIPKYKTSYKY